MTIVDTYSRHFYTQGTMNTTVTAVLTGGIVHDEAVKNMAARRRGDPLPAPSGDLAVYEGIGSPEWIAGHGCKVPYDAALVYFPDLTRAHYRD